ncbi:MAG: type II toxin-antitoxin system prevent-host-death family antitoxin [Lentisphaerae bacterium]|nr:type II toxin-antitoxin system prevent-host-death family antitoxin [Lentisphaerota bacterium]
MKALQSVYEAKARFSSLLNEVREKKCTIVICRHGVPVADLVPHQAARNPFRVRESLVGAKYLCDPTAPLEKDDWPEALR